MSMRLFRSLGLVIAYVLLSIIWLYPPQASGEEGRPTDIRPTVLAGTWYPRDKQALATSIQGFLSRATVPPLGGELQALVVPHAGHRYSGAVAAHAYKLLEDMPFRRVILIGPSHRVRFSGVSVNLQSGYETPLGVVPVDLELARQILNAKGVRHLKAAHAQEHCLEIQLPFLQTVLKNFRIVPIIMGQQDYATCSNLAEALVHLLRAHQDTLLLASSDLSHYHPYDQAMKLDHRFIQDFKGLDPQALSKDLSSGACEACGGGPVITVLLAAKAMGANKPVILNHANSGDVTGDHSSVVGYVSAALIKASDKDPHPQ